MCMLDTLLNAGDEAGGKVNGILGIYSPSCCLLLDRLGSAWVWTPGTVTHKNSRKWMVPSGFGSWVEFLSQLLYSYRNWFCSHFTMVMGIGEQKVVGLRTKGDTEGDVRCSHSGNLMTVVKITLSNFCIILEEMFLM